MLRDVLNGLRLARRNPGLTLAAVVLLGLGVGVNAAVFTVARTLVLQPLPFEHPDRLVSVWRDSRQTGVAYGASWPHLEEWKLRTDLFVDVQAYTYSLCHAASESSAASTVDPAWEFQVTEGFFRLLGVRPMAGGLFAGSEFEPEFTTTAPSGAPRPVLVSYDFWRRRLLGRADAIGRVIEVDASARIVIGVLPRGFRILRDDLPEVFTPLRPFPGHLGDRRMSYLQVIGRLRPGIGITRARAELEAASRAAEAAKRATDGGFVYRIEDLRERLFGALRPTLAVLLAGAALVLLAACGNLAILLLVRGAGRRREITIRLALGAGRRRIARQVLVEGLVLAMVGGAAGLLLAAWAADLLSWFSATLDLGLPGMTIDGAVVAFTFAVSAGAGGLFGLAPLFDAWRTDIGAELRSGAHGSAGISSSFLGGRMAVVEVALSMVLLSCAALLLLAFARVNRVDPGFRSEGVLALSLGQAPHAPDARRRENVFWAQLLERARAVPGVRSAAFSGDLPLALRHAPENMKARITLPGRDLPPPGFLQAEYQDVSPGYFRTMGIPLVQGRDFEDRPADGAAAIVNESFSREWWGGRNPVGERIGVPGGRPYTIVGVVGDVRQHDLRSAPRGGQIYRPLLRSDASTLSKWPSQYLVVRTSGDPTTLQPVLAEVVASLDPARRVTGARTLDDVAVRSTAWERVKMTVVGVFALSALVLSVVGLHAVLSHVVARRRREIAIRVALGGQPRDIRRAVLREGATLIAVGVAIGAVAVLGLAASVGSRLIDIAALDLLTMVPVAIVLSAAGLAACYPATRAAARVDVIRVWQAE